MRKAKHKQKVFLFKTYQQELYPIAFVYKDVCFHNVLLFSQNNIYTKYVVSRANQLNSSKDSII